MSGQRGIVVACGSDGKLVSWDIETTNILNDFKGHDVSNIKNYDDKIVWSCEISNDGKTLVSSSDDKTIRVWDVRTGNCLRVLNGHTSHVNDCHISNDGTLIVSCSWDLSVRIWETHSAKCVNTHKKHTLWVLSYYKQIFFEIVF
jgi:WD40 repeat protein